MSRICFVNMPIEYYSPVTGGAISTIIREVGAALEEDGHDVSVVTREDGGSHHEVGQVIGIGPIPSRRWHRGIIGRVTRGRGVRESGEAKAYRRDVLRALGRLAPRPDCVVVFNDYTSPTWIAPAAPAASIICWLQNDQPVPSTVDDVTRNVDWVLTCSEYITSCASARGLPPAMLRTAASGVDSNAFHPRPSWLDPPDPVRVLCIGRLDPNKGHDAALGAIEALQREGRAVDVTLAGARWWWGEPLDAYGAGLVARVEAVGGRYAGLVPRPDVPSLMRDHDVVCVLSRAQEPFGLVVLEAMASGCAVITSGRGGLEQAAGGAAIVANPDSPDEVEVTLRGLLDPGRLRSFKELSRRRAERAPWASAASVLAQSVAPRPRRGPLDRQPPG